MASLELVEQFLNTIDERSFSRHGAMHVPGDRLTSSQVLKDWLATHDLPSEPADLSTAVALRTALRQALSGDVRAALADYPLRLAVDSSGELRMTAASGTPWVDAIVETVAESAARGEWKRLKLCAAPDCRWAFYDASRSGRGRWCDMNACGNRHKTRTYRERRQEIR